MQSGQVFRWKKEKAGWTGVINGNLVRIGHGDNGLEVQGGGRGMENKLLHYFRIDDDYETIMGSINTDALMSTVLRNLRGLRLIRQDPWECTISYICATNSNIPSIVNMIENICRRFGEQSEFEGGVFHTFPSPARIAGADIHTLRECKVGYRAKFIKETASRVLSDETIFSRILDVSYLEGTNILMSNAFGRKTLPGIGPKVADCILLFSLEKIQAFPIDTWILRAILDHYSFILGEEYASSLRPKLNFGKSLSPGDYLRISKRMRDYFGRFAGYAQEFLYYYSRKGGESRFMKEESP